MKKERFLTPTSDLHVHLNTHACIPTNSHAPINMQTCIPARTLYKHTRKSKKERMEGEQGSKRKGVKGREVERATDEDMALVTS